MAGALARRGHAVTILAPPDGEGTVPPGVVIERVARVPLAKPDAGSGPRLVRLPHDVRLAARLRRIAPGFDVVHAHHAEAALLARAVLPRSIPLVHSVHAHLADELPQWLPLRGLRTVGALVDRLAAGGADANLALSPGGARRLLEGRVHGVSLCAPAIDPAELDGADATRARARWDLGDRPWVLYTGNLDPYQEVSRLVRVVARLTDAGLMVIGGDDPAPVHAAADAAGLPVDRRRFVRSAAFSDTRDAIAAATVGAIPRTRCVGFPVKLLNLLGLGLPTVVSQGSHTPIDGAIAAPDADDDAFARHLHRWLVDPVARSAASRSARSAVLRSWTWDARAVELESIYLDLLHRKNGDPGVPRGA